MNIKELIKANLKTIDIGPLTFTLHYDFEFNSSNINYGHCDFNLMQIMIADIPNQWLWLETLVHELTHAVDFVYNNDGLTEDATESVAQGWTHIIKQVVAIKVLTKRK